jgi:hypothetical protein
MADQGVACKQEEEQQALVDARQCRGQAGGLRSSPPM